MRIRVVDERVRHNIKLFLDLLRRANYQHARILPFKLFKAWVNRETGQFFARGASHKLSLFSEREWKPVEVCCVYNPQEGEIYFLLEEGETKEPCFHCNDLTPIALAIMRDTLKTLNAVTKCLKGPSDLKTKMRVITKLEIDVEAHSGNILNKTWYPVDRWTAESLLWGKPEGTYLLRKDPFAEILEKQLQRERGVKVKCLTVTYVQQDNKFSELTLVHCDGYWLVYNDDPSLESTRKYSDLMHFLREEKVLKFPLYH